MKKALSLFMSIVMLLSITAGLDFSVYAGNTNDGWIYSVNYSSTDGGSSYSYKVTVEGYNGTNKDVTIPSSIAGYNVVYIGENAFYNAKNLNSVVIPNNIISIGENAFGYCTGLKELKIPCSAKMSNTSFIGCENIEKITITSGNGTMQNYTLNIDDTSLTYYKYTPWYISNCNEVIIESGVQNIGAFAFDSCNKLTKITIPNSVLVIGDCAFSWCRGLTSITIPDSVVNIGDLAFSNCTGLKEIKIPCDTKINYSQTNTYKGEVLPSFLNCNNINKISITKGNSGNMRDYNCNENSISYYQFTPWYISKCSEIIIEDGVKKIGAYSFYNCNSIENIEIPESVTKVGDCAFVGCKNYQNKEYEIKYDANGGLNAPAKQIKHLGETITITSEIPFREGYTFKGWSSTSSGSVEYNSGDNYAVNKDIVLFAVWIKSYTISYNVDGNFHLQNKCQDEEVVLNYCPTKNNMKLIGWSTEKNGDIKYKPYDKYSENKDIVLFAVWKYKCSECNGSGQKSDKYKCTTCNGLGTRTVSSKCSTCNGSGKITTQKTSTCWNCKGEAVVWNSTTQRWEVCLWCSGTGEIITSTESTCSYCNGKGIITSYVKCGNCTEGWIYNTYQCTNCNGTGAVDYYIEPTPPSTTKQPASIQQPQPIPTQPTTTAPVQTTTQPAQTTTAPVQTTTTKSSTTVKNPKSTSISKLTKGKKQFKVTWKKVGSISGYQIQYSTDKKFKKNVKTVTAKKGSTSATIKKLKSRKTYFVRVRTYKTTKVNGKTTKVYSSWSKVKSVKTK